jgi:hypothetical protein
MNFEHYFYSFKMTSKKFKFLICCMHIFSFSFFFFFFDLQRLTNTYVLVVLKSNPFVILLFAVIMRFSELVFGGYPLLYFLCLTSISSELY